MHRLLQRQLKRYFGPEEFHPPWCEFLQAIDEFYCSADAFREVLERSLVLSTQELHQANAEMRAIFQAIPDLVFRVQLDGTILEIKAGTEDDLWSRSRELLGKKLQNVPDASAAAALQKLLERSGGNGEMGTAEYSLNIHGEQRHYEARLVPMLAGQAVAIVQNITARKRREALLEERRLELQCANQQLQEEMERRHAMEEQLRYEASHDRLTGLANRSLVMQRIEHCSACTLRDPHFKYALLFIDVDDFKEVNDQFGHQAGDSVLVGIAERLSDSIRAGDMASRPSMASRLGGDEFVVLLEGISCGADALRVAERIEHGMQEPFQVAGRRLIVQLSIGIALGCAEGTAMEEILRRADEAVYRAKREGKHRIALFDPATEFDDFPREPAKTRPF